jgi:hypothetical protein
MKKKNLFTLILGWSSLPRKHATVFGALDKRTTFCRTLFRHHELDQRTNAARASAPRLQRWRTRSRTKAHLTTTAATMATRRTCGSPVSRLATIVAWRARRPRGADRSSRRLRRTLRCKVTDLLTTVARCRQRRARRWARVGGDRAFGAASRRRRRRRRSSIGGDI